MPTKKEELISFPTTYLSPRQRRLVPRFSQEQKLAEKDPGKVTQNRSGLGRGKALRRIAKSEKVAPETVAAILKRESKSVSRAVSDCRADELCFPGLHRQDHPKAMRMRSLRGCFRSCLESSATERADLGQATSVIEHKASLTIDDVRRELAEMKRDAVDAETKEEK